MPAGTSTDPGDFAHRPEEVSPRSEHSLRTALERAALHSGAGLAMLPVLIQRIHDRVRRRLVRSPRVAITPVDGEMVLCGHGDGAWSVHAASIQPGGLCYAFGIGTDISFDRAVIERFGLTVQAFDPTPLSLQWLAHQDVPPQFVAHPWGLGARDGPATLALPLDHRVSFVPVSDRRHRGLATCELLRLPTIRARLGHVGIPITLLKLDIEGGEYVVMDQIAGDPDIRQVVVEFHHRMWPHTASETEAAVQVMRAAGFEVVHRSPRGFEYVFLRNPA